MYIVVFVTAKDEQEAKKISEKLLSEKLIACANIVKGIESLFWWEGKIDHANETLLVLKTKRSLFKKLEKTVKSVHSYSTPEIIALPIIQGNRDYLRWISDSVG